MDRMEIWDAIVEHGIATEEELELVTAINGYHDDALNDVIWVRTGYRSIEQLLEEEQEVRAMFEYMKINNKCDVFGIEKTSDNQYIIYRYDSYEMLKTDAVLYDELFMWLDIEPFETLEKCYDFMMSHIDDLIQLGG